MVKKHLSTNKIIKFYQENGYYFPLNVFNDDEIDYFLSQLTLIESSSSEKINSELRFKSHLVFPFLSDIVRNSKILDIVELILGPNILVWGSGFFIKEPQSDSFVSWHQDSNYWGLSHNNVTTAWIAFSSSNTKSGCMKVIPGSHESEIMGHADKPHKNNLLSRGQSITNLKNEHLAKDLILERGQVSLHHVGIAHASEPNFSSERRIGFAIRYIPPYIKQTTGNIDSATLVRGTDEYNHFLVEPIPSTNFDHKANLFRINIWDNAKKFLMKK